MKTILACALGALMLIIPKTACASPVGKAVWKVMGQTLDNGVIAIESASYDGKKTVDSIGLKKLEHQSPDFSNEKKSFVEESKETLENSISRMALMGAFIGFAVLVRRDVTKKRKGSKKE